ncbi:MAG: beta-lactamase, partial [Parcubacteria group bacterium Licking1014_17]
VFAPATAGSGRGARLVVSRIALEKSSDFVQETQHTYMWPSFLENLRYKKIILLTAIIFILLIGILFGYYLGGKSNDKITLLREPAHYGLINPLLGFDIPETEGFKNGKQLEGVLTALVNNKKAQKKISKAAMYVRKLNGGEWVGINENEKFSPASMSKVVIMITYLKAAESNPNILNYKIKYDGSTDMNTGEFFKPSHNLQAGSWYTIEDLIGRMIEYSDNTAMYYLVNNNSFDIRTYNDAYTDLGLPARTLDEGIDYMSAKDYSNFYRVLYNATYLTRELSQKALEILSQADFNDGLVGDIPREINVAHKFGERSVRFQDGSIARELHDCGIVYYPDNSYFLCVMTKGDNFTDLAAVIKEISQTVYLSFK